MQTIKRVGHHKLALIILGVICAGAIVLNVVVRRAPVQDANAVQDLQIIAASVNTYISNSSKMPTDLSDVSKSFPADTLGRMRRYELKPLSMSEYELCATFLAASKGNANYAKPYGAEPDPSIHDKGYQCFKYKVAPNGMYGVPQPAPVAK